MVEMEERWPAKGVGCCWPLCWLQKEEEEKMKEREGVGVFIKGGKTL